MYSIFFQVNKHKSSDSNGLSFFAYRAAEAHGALYAAQGVVKDLLRKIEHTLLEQQNDGRAAEAEKTLFLAAPRNSGLAVIFYLADETRADLDLNDGTEIFGVHDAVFAGVLHEYRPFAHNDRLHGVIAPLDMPVAALEAVVDVAVAVIVFNTKPEHEADTVHVVRGYLSAADEIVHVVPAALYRKLGVGAYPVGRHAAVAGGDERVGLHVHRPCAVLDLTGEEVVEAAVILLYVIAHVELVCADEMLYPPRGERGVHICSDDRREYRVCHDTPRRKAEMLAVAVAQADRHFL